MVRNMLASSLLASLALLLSSTSAQCPYGCDTIQARFSNGSPLSGGVDPNDFSYLGILADFCPCNNGEILNVAITATMTDNSVQSATTSVAWPGASEYRQVIFPISIEMNEIQSGSPVTQYFYVTGEETGAFPVNSFQYSPVTSIYYATKTRTVTSTEVSSETVGTVTDTITHTTKVPQKTVKKPCSTETATVTAPTSTKSVIITKTPKELTHTQTSVTIVTVHSSCVKSTSATTTTTTHRLNERYFSRSTEVGLGQVETPFFSALEGTPTPTTYTYALSMTTSTTTITAEITATQTKTTLTTETPNPRTTTICGTPAQTTTTITPSVTVTSTDILKGKTTTTTSTLTETTTIYPQDPPKPCPTHKNNNVGIVKPHSSPDESAGNTLKLEKTDR